MKFVVLAPVLGLLLIGCAGSTGGPAQSPAVPPPQTATPAGVPQGESSFQPAASAPAVPSSPAPAAPPPMSASAAPQAAPAESRGSVADRSELDRAEQIIASGDCPTACRALGSMERSVSFLCARTDGDGVSPACADARNRLKTSRRRVRASCGQCAGGPSVDTDAPIPSR